MSNAAWWITWCIAEAAAGDRLGLEGCLRGNVTRVSRRVTCRACSSKGQAATSGQGTVRTWVWDCRLACALGRDMATTGLCRRVRARSMVGEQQSRWA